MGSVWEAQDNAKWESSAAIPEFELLIRREFQTKAYTCMAIFELIKGWYDPARRHSTLGYQPHFANKRRQAEQLESANV
ncbi:hypothetical protein [uncultured Roseibium sp.]|uniref:hypothetical protein n=1 Tax=uncultured Roseibium sp. TaxID=1936171 RepID=UPI003217DF37